MIYSFQSNLGSTKSSQHSLSPLFTMPSILNTSQSSTFLTKASFLWEKKKKGYFLVFICLNHSATVNMVTMPFLFFPAQYVRHNLLALTLTHFKRKIQFFLVSVQNHAVITTVQFSNISIIPKISLGPIHALFLKKSLSLVL